MQMLDLIERKRLKQKLTKDEIEFIVTNFTKGTIPDYQMAALLMAICLNGMNEAETFALTEAMIKSGSVVSYDSNLGVVVDKHSTGGIGDKTTPIVVSLVAALGGKVAKMSGRGLGFTGGTADKLASIRNYQLNLSPAEFKRSLIEVGAAMVYQTGNVAPADRKIYALRDVTGTVASVPLIASSIMSKKIALGAQALVLDVKVGAGAFMSNLKEARRLAELMVKIGNHFKCRTIALITNMDYPLGNAIGNKLEIQEVYRILNNEEDNNLKQLCLELAAQMLNLSSNQSLKKCRSLVTTALEDGRALTKFKEIVTNQGGDLASILETKVRSKIKLRASKAGYIQAISAPKIGKAAMLLGAGRQSLGDSIDYEVGIVLNKQVGDYVQAKEQIATLYVNDDTNLDRVRQLVQTAFTYAPEKRKLKPIIRDLVK